MTLINTWMCGLQCLFVLAFIVNLCFRCCLWNYEYIQWGITLHFYVISDSILCFLLLVLLTYSKRSSFEIISSFADVQFLFHTITQYLPLQITSVSWSVHQQLRDIRVWSQHSLALTCENFSILLITRLMMKRCSWSISSRCLIDLNNLVGRCSLVIQQSVHRDLKRNVLLVGY